MLESEHTDLTLGELARRRVILPSLSFQSCKLGGPLTIDTSG